MDAGLEIFGKSAHGRGAIGCEGGPDDWTHDRAVPGDREIGRGGMGVVYLAQRADDQFRRQVALKIVHPDLVDRQTLNRFENEQQTLAGLDHPNIIKLLDGGTTEDGLPWLAMDYMEGEAIDRYCETHRLSIAERVGLFRTVCGAVHYAHQNLVIHRDLKPREHFDYSAGRAEVAGFWNCQAAAAGVLFEDGGANGHEFTADDAEICEPRADSGIAAHHDQRRVFTGRSALPVGGGAASVRGQIAFAVGIGARDLRNRPGEAEYGHSCATAVRGCDRVFSRVGVSEDLDVIILMAMRKEPQRRYASAEHFSEDLRLLLEERPVSARKDTWAYRASKLVARHKAGTAVAALAVVALLIMGLVAYREYLQAQRRAQELRQFAQVVLDIDEGLQSGRVETRAAKLAKAVESLDGLARDGGRNPELQRDLVRAYVNLANVQGNLYSANLGNTAGAETLYRKALAIAEDLRRADPNRSEAKLDVALCNRDLADILLAKGDRAAALAKYGVARPIFEALVAANASDQEALKGLVITWGNIGNTYDALGDPVSATESYQKCADAARLWVALDPSRKISLAFAMEKKAYYGMLSGRAANAEPAIQEALDIFLQASRANPSPTARRNVFNAYDTLARVKRATARLLKRWLLPTRAWRL